MKNLSFRFFVKTLFFISLFAVFLFPNNLVKANTDETYNYFLPCGINPDNQQQIFCPFQIIINRTPYYTPGEEIDVRIYIMSGSPQNELVSVTFDGQQGLINDWCQSDCVKFQYKVDAPSVTGYHVMPITGHWYSEQYGSFSAGLNMTYYVGLEGYQPPPMGYNLPSVSITANPNPVFYGEPTTINWFSSNASECKLWKYGFWDSPMATSGPTGIGSYSIATALQDTTYLVECTGTPISYQPERNRNFVFNTFEKILNPLLREAFAEQGDPEAPPEVEASILIDVIPWGPVAVNLTDQENQNGPYTVVLGEQQPLRVTALNAKNCQLKKDGINKFSWAYVDVYNFPSDLETLIGDHNYKVICTNPIGGSNSDEEIVDYVSNLPPQDQPNLTVIGLGNPTSIQEDVPVVLQSTVKNIGSASTISGFSNFFQVRNTDPGEGIPSTYNNFFKTKKVYGAGGGGGGGVSFLVDLPATQMSALDAGSSSVTSEPYIFESAGTHWFRACADKSNRSTLPPASITESNEEDNCGAWTEITVTAPVQMPDLIVWSDSSPSTVSSPNQKVTLTATIKNIGGVSTGSGFNNFYQVSSQDPNGGGIIPPTGMIKSSFFASLISKVIAEGTNPIIDLTPPLWLQALGPGSTGTITKSNYQFPSAGIYYIRACADKSNSMQPGTINESNNDNNCYPWKTVVVGQNPINGQCSNSASHWNCATGTSIKQVENTNSWTWDCQGANGGNSVSCVENKLEMSGWLTAEESSCTIQKGQSSCKIKFSWQVTNPEDPITKITKPKNVEVATGHSGTQKFDIKYPSEHFYLYNNAKELADKEVFSSCASGLVWDGESCEKEVIPQNLADLTASYIQPQSVLKGTSINFSAVISNIGNASTEIAFSTLFQMADNEKGGGAKDLSSVQTPIVGASKSVIVTSSTPYTFSQEGTKYVRACADKSSGGSGGGDIFESNENNNCSVWTPVTASSTPPILPAHCNNNVFEPKLEETGVDCGGECPACSIPKPKFIER